VMEFCIVTTLQYCSTVQQVVPAEVALGTVNQETAMMIFVNHIHLDTSKHLMIPHTMSVEGVSMC